MMHYWGYGPEYYGGYGYGFGFNLFSFILTVLFWWLVIMLGIKLIKWISGSHHSHEHCAECRHSHEEAMTDDEEYVEEDDSNIAIVKERYAKGEITKKEFEQLKKDLS